MKTLYVAVSFLMALGMGLGIYSASYNQFNLSNASTTFLTTTEVISTAGQEVTNIVTGVVNGTTTTTTISSSTSTSTNNQGCGIFCTVWDGIVSVATTVCNFTSFNLFGTSACSQIATQIAPVETNLGNQAIILGTKGASGQTTSNNFWLKLTASPLDTALLIMGVFLGLGVLAGLLGAGILARVMASVGIGIAMITYIQAQLTVFNGMPPLVYFGFNGIVALLLVIIAWESFNAPGAAG